MHPEIAKLLILQEIDGEIHKLRQEFERYPIMRKTRLEEVARARATLAQAQDRHRALRLELHRAELEVRRWREEIRRLMGQQSAVKTQKEYDALTHEMAEIEGKISDSDEKGLAVLGELEELEAKIARLTEDLAHKEEGCAQEMARLKTLEDEKRALLEGFSAKRCETAATIDASLLARYTRLAGQYPGHCVVPLRDGNCGGCNLRILPRRLQELGRPDTICECDSCHRFLYLE